MIKSIEGTEKNMRKNGVWNGQTTATNSSQKTSQIEIQIVPKATIQNQYKMIWLLHKHTLIFIWMC